MQMVWRYRKTGPNTHQTWVNASVYPARYVMPSPEGCSCCHLYANVFSRMERRGQEEKRAGGACNICVVREVHNAVVAGSRYSKRTIHCDEFT